MAMISASNLVELGHMSRWSELTWAKRPKASVQEVVVVVVAAVHRPRALPGLPEGVLLLGHHLQLAEDLLVAPARLGEPAVDVEAVVIREGAHGVVPSGARGWSVARPRVMSDPAHCTATLTPVPKRNPPTFQASPPTFRPSTPQAGTLRRRGAVSWVGMELRFGNG